MYEEYYAHLDRVEKIYADFSVKMAELNDKVQGSLPYQQDMNQIDKLVNATRKTLQKAELDWYLAAPLTFRLLGVRYFPVWYVLFPWPDPKIKDAYGLPQRGYIAPPETGYHHSDLQLAFEEEAVARDLAASLNLGRLLRQGKLQ